MKRHAILIQAPLSGRDALSGVSADIFGWKKHLMSLSGGAWNRDEIILLKNPSLTTLKSALILAKYSDLAIVAFSGHGFVKKNNLGIFETFLYINESRTGSIVSEFELNPGTPRCIVSLDCCRHVETQSLTECVTADFSETSSEIERLKYRAEYERKFMMCEKGCTRLYSASLDESASDQPSFTQIMMRFAEKWSHDNPNGSMNVRDVLLATADLMKVNGLKQQTPVYNAGRRLNHFPFIIGGVNNVL